MILKKLKGLILVLNIEKEEKYTLVQLTSQLQES